MYFIKIRNYLCTQMSNIQILNKSEGFNNKMCKLSSCKVLKMNYLIFFN